MNPYSPPWLELARQNLGVREIPGSRHNSVIVQWWKDIHQAIVDDETPYCAAFVGAMLNRSGYPGTDKPNARSYLQWGATLRFPIVGCIVVYERPPSTWSGHVGFAVGHDENDNIVTIGANQKDQVSQVPFLRRRVLGYRWPLGAAYPFAAIPQDFPLIAGAAPVSTNEA